MIYKVDIKDELLSAYSEYAKNVILTRAIPDLADGFKKSQRRIVYHMLKKDYKGFIKSARIVGEVLGLYHPHGESALYQTLVRMGQPFVNNILWIIPQGNFGSIDGDMPAAMRYTEASLSKMARENFSDLKNEVVELMPNYDGSEVEASVLPSILPSILLNGSQGIAVGCVSSIPPHNIGELLDACIAMLWNRDEDPMKFILGPDFPTGGVITNGEEMRSIYENGHGSIKIHPTYEMEDDLIRFTSVPFNVNKSRIYEQIIKLVNEDVILGVDSVLDKSKGSKINIEIRFRGSGKVIVNKILKYVPEIRKSFNMVLNLIHKQKFKSTDIKNLLLDFLNYREEITVKRIEHRISVLNREMTKYYAECLLSFSDAKNVLDTIKGSEDLGMVKRNLYLLFGKTWTDNMSIICKSMNVNEDDFKSMILKSEIGSIVDRLLEIKIGRLNISDKDKTVRNLRETFDEMLSNMSTLKDRNKLLKVMEEDFKKFDQYRTERKTAISNVESPIDDVDLIENKSVILFFIEGGYLYNFLKENVVLQNRTGKGRCYIDLLKGHRVKKALMANKHDSILFLSDADRMRMMPIYKITEDIEHVNNLLFLQENEKIKDVYHLNFNSKYVVIVYKSGKLFKISSERLIKTNRSGIKFGNSKDEVVNILECDDADHIMLTDGKRVVKFRSSELRATGSKTSCGVIGMKTDSDVISSETIKETEDTLILDENGKIKTVGFSDIRISHRGSKGVLISGKNKVIKISRKKKDSESLIITKKGRILNFISDLRQTGRRSTGVISIKNMKSDSVMDLINV